MTHSRQPTVSIVIIFWNAEPFLDGAIKSVCAQTMSEWELLLVDDGSTDGSTAIAQGWAARHGPHIRYLEHEGHQNLGMSASRNWGVTHARGEFVAFLDADDEWLPDHLSHQLAILRAEPEVVMTYGPLIYWRDGETSGIQKLEVTLDEVVPPPRLIPVLLTAPEASPSGVLARREVIVGLGGAETRFRGMYEDQVLWCKVAARYPIFVSSYSGYKYRLHAESCCARSLADGSHLHARREFLIWLKCHVREQQIHDPDVLRAWAAEWSRFFGWRARSKRYVRAVLPSSLRRRIRKVFEPASTDGGPRP